MDLPPLDELVFKCTHNSYDCSKDHPPEDQIDLYGVWGIELDFGIRVGERGPVAIIGHDGEGDGTCQAWGRLLRGFLDRVARSRSRQYRPIFFFFDFKNWGDPPYDHESAQPLGLGVAEHELMQAFEGKVVFLDEYYRRNNSFPTISSLAGHAITRIPRELPATWCNECNLTWQRVEQAIMDGAARLCNDHDPPARRGFCFIRLDQFRADWTFKFGVPPNPIVVRASAPPTYFENDCGQLVFVGEQGTFKFPYRTIDAGVLRAAGKLGLVDNPTRRRSGYGWTILITPGNYPGALEIRIPLTLKKDESHSGDVVIGG